MFRYPPENSLPAASRTPRQSVSWSCQAYPNFFTRPPSRRGMYFDISRKIYPPPLIFSHSWIVGSGPSPDLLGTDFLMDFYCDLIWCGLICPRFSRKQSSQTAHVFWNIRKELIWYPSLELFLYWYLDPVRPLIHLAGIFYLFFTRN